MFVSSVFYYYSNNLGYNYRIKLLSDVQIQSLTFTYLLWTSHAEQSYRVPEVVGTRSSWTFAQSQGEICFSGQSAALLEVTFSF